jgi:hypothetical protein
MARLLIFLLFFLVLAGSVSADCIYNGKNYSEGTVMGPYVCRDNQWVRK